MGAGKVGRQRLWVIRLDPDQTNSDQLILTCSIFWIFVLLVIVAETISYRTAFHANALIGIESDFVRQCIFSLFGSVEV